MSLVCLVFFSVVAQGKLSTFILCVLAFLMMHHTLLLNDWLHTHTHTQQCPVGSARKLQADWTRLTIFSFLTAGLRNRQQRGTYAQDVDDTDKNHENRKPDGLDQSAPLWTGLQGTGQDRTGWRLQLSSLIGAGCVCENVCGSVCESLYVCERGYVCARAEDEGRAAA